jgi:hypothetical protein
MHSEISEALEEYRNSNNTKMTEIYYNFPPNAHKFKPEGISIDLRIYVSDYLILVKFLI